jgi:hypothetical protein
MAEKIKSIKPIKSKIKVILPTKKGEEESELEENIEDTELEKFAQFLQGTSSLTDTNPLSPNSTDTIAQQQTRTPPPQPETETSQQEQTPEREPYSTDTGGRTYESFSGGVKSIREKNVYMPALHNNPTHLVSQGTEPVQLQDREIRGRQFMGQDSSQQQELDTPQHENKERRKYKAEHQG